MNAHQIYAKDYIGRVLGTHDLRGLEIPADLLQDVFSALTRQEEIITPERDEWGNFDCQHSQAFRAGNHQRAWLDEMIIQAFPLIERKSIWPNNKPFALCLTHDTDELGLHVHYSKLKREFTRVQDPNFARRFLKGFISAGTHLARSVNAAAKPETLQIEEWLKLEDKYGFKSTFHIFPQHVNNRHAWDCDYRYADKVVYQQQLVPFATVMRAVHKAGWEIGVHGSYESAFNADLLLAQKHQIEDVIKAEVISTRQHYLHFAAQTTPSVQVQAGLKADSTLGFNRNIGFRAGASFPFRMWDHKNQVALDLLQIPMHIMDVSLFRADTLKLDEASAIAHAVRLLDHVCVLGGCLTLNWHTQLLHVPHMRRVYETLLDEAARRCAWGCSMGEMLAWVKRNYVSV
ncbi:MAG: polysaccharide deacetylase family protein [Chloroflexota bacterium]